MQPIDLLSTVKASPECRAFGSTGNRREYLRGAPHQSQVISDCLDALDDPGLRVSGVLERFSGGSGWRGYLYSFT